MDEELGAAYAAARAGDAAGFAVLWRSLQPLVLRYLRVLAGQSAEDVASETWLQVARDLHRFQGDAAEFRVWLFRLARNRGIDELRKAGRRREIYTEEGVAPEQQPTADAAQEALDGFDTAWAIRIISSLPRIQAEVVMLRVVAGLDVGQVADVLGKRPGAVRVAAMRGLRQLAQHAEVQARQAARAGEPETGRRPARPTWQNAV